MGTLQRDERGRFQLLADDQPIDLARPFFQVPDVNVLAAPGAPLDVSGWTEIGWVDESGSE